MLYYMYDVGRTALDSWTPAATAARAFVTHPLSPFSATAAGRAVAAFSEIAERTMRRYVKPRFAIPAVEAAGRRRAVHERDLLAHPFGRLLRYEVEGLDRRPRVLVVNPLSGHFSALLEDLYVGLLADHDVHVLEWNDARDVPLLAGSFGLDDQIALVLRALRLLGPGTHLVGFSQSTIPTLAATALLAEDGDTAAPATLTLMGGPVDTRVNPNPLNRLIRAHPVAWFHHNLISEVPFYYPGALRRVFPGFVQIGTYVSAAVDRHVDAHYAFFDSLLRGDGESVETHRAFFDRFHAVMDLPAEFFLDMVDRVFREATLAEGTMTWRGRPVRTEAIRQTALFTVEADEDVLAAPGQTHAAHDLCPGVPKREHRRLTLAGAGHLGIVHGRPWRDDVRPALSRFVADHERSPHDRP